MAQRAPFPLNSAAHGALAQGRAGADWVTLFQGWARLTTDRFGAITGGSYEGFYAGDTRFLSRFRLLANGKPLKHTFSAQISATEWCGMFLESGSPEPGNPAGGSRPGGSTELRVLRAVNGGWDESILVRNNGSEARRLELAIEIVCPIGEGLLGLVPEVRWRDGEPTLSYERRFGFRRRAPTPELSGLYGARAPRDGDEVRRALELAVSVAKNGAAGALDGQLLEIDTGEETRLRAIFELPPGREVELKLRFQVELDKTRLASRSGARTGPLPRPERSSSQPRTRIQTGNSTLNLILGQAERDLEALALPLTPGDERGTSVFNAGIPRYMGLFSRDILTTALQSSLYNPRALREAVEGLALFKGKRTDPWRDEEPDQLPHEVRMNPEAALGETNRELYYGDVVATPFWLVIALVSYLWEGDRELLVRQRATIQSCCDWIERRLARGNGFVYYAPGTSEGNRHHAWKDSGDAIVDRHGRVAVPPLATSEVQGFCHLALLAGAELNLALGEISRAGRLLGQARALKRRFNEAFWLEDLNYFAVALDGDGRRIDSISSNPGHCLGCGIIAREKVAPVVARLMSEELFSGWGIRTLSSDNPAFDPYSYHRGSVWPVENATFAGGFRLCGYDEHCARLIEAQLATATVFPSMRLPEVLSGHARGDTYPIPGLYEDSNPLQAWSVSAIFFFLLVLLGIRPVAPLGVLEVRPYLPEWLPWIELRGLRVGTSVVDLRFWRDARGRSRWRVLSKAGTLRILDEPAELNAEAALLSRLSGAIRGLWKSA
ncbi:MAG: hypothetical protein NDJ89_12475 [Oligoflexia bacterium]|nr:hypothetical protein [Oligoflexia bacterium]